MFTLFLTVCLNYTCTIRPIGRYDSFDACYKDAVTVKSTSGGGFTCSPTITEVKNYVAPGICIRNRKGICVTADNEV